MKTKIYRIITMVLFTALPYLISSLTYFSLNISTHPSFVRFLEAILTIAFFLWYMKMLSDVVKKEKSWDEEFKTACVDAEMFYSIQYKDKKENLISESAFFEGADFAMHYFNKYNLTKIDIEDEL